MEETQVIELPTEPISISEAARRYGLSARSLHRWVANGLIKVVSRPTRYNETWLDPEDLARAVRLYKAAPGQGRNPLRDLKKDGKVEALSS